MSRTTFWVLLIAVWLVGAFGSGALLALLYRRLHPSLSFHKLWVFWTLVISVLVAVILLAVGL